MEFKAWKVDNRFQGKKKGRQYKLSTFNILISRVTEVLPVASG